MKVVRKGSDQIKGIIGKARLSHDAKYRLSGFCFLCSKPEVYLAKLTLTSEVVYLTRDEYEFLSNLKDVSLKEIEQAGLVELVNKRFIVEESYDEYERYNDLLSIVKIMRKKPMKGFTKYTILPTTGCNARCIYCFEQGMVAETMSVETADRLIEYIYETNAYNGTDKEINIDWFGGEPLAVRSIVTRICQGLTDKGIKFRSTIVTNGSLITPEYVSEMKDIWNLKNVQLSVDGSREDYAVRKAYVNPVLHNYDVVLNAIGYLADADISVSLRCNVDLDNVAHLESFITDLKREIVDKGRNKVKLYFAPLHQIMASDEIKELMIAINRAYDQMDELGAGSMTSLPIRNSFRVNFCMADTMDSNIIIMPDGSFNNCENFPEGHCWGNIFEGVTDVDLYNELKSVREAADECKYCTFLPTCTSYRKHSCPVTMKHCREYEEIRNKYYLLHKFEPADDKDGEDPC